MHSILRTSLPILVGLMVASCTDATSSPSATETAPARVALAPAFTPSASAAYATLASNGIVITDVRIELRTTGGTVALDTVIVFPAASDAMSIELALMIRGREQQFDALIELRDANGVVQFSTTQRVTARDARLPQVPSLPLSLTYVGPGAAVRSVVVSGGAVSVLAGGTRDLIAAGLDASGRAVVGTTVTWSSSDTSIAAVASVGDLQGRLTSRGPRGTVTLTARTNGGIVGTANVTVLPRAAHLRVIAGAAQSGSAFTLLPVPFTVELLATDNLPMAGHAVTFRAIADDADVATELAITDSAGRARTTITLGRAAGTYTYEAVSSGVTAVMLSATATAPVIGPAVQLIPLSPLPQSFKAGVAAAETFRARLADAHGNYVTQAGVPLTATMVQLPSGTATSVTVQSDANGIFALTLGAFAHVGTVTITLSSPVMPFLPYGTFKVEP